MMSYYWIVKRHPRFVANFFNQRDLALGTPYSSGLWTHRGKTILNFQKVDGS